MRVRLFLLLSFFCSVSPAADFATLCTNRTAIERVYYNHRLGTKPPFEEALPQATLERLVRLDLDKEAVLQKNYGVTISPAQLAAEIQRIDTSTRAPEMLAEIKAALGNDPEKFANAFAKPLLVERELRRRFENDDALHAAARRECEQVRFALLTARTNGASPTQLLEQLRRDHSNEVSDVTWQLGARPAETNAPAADELEVRQRFGPDAQILSTAAAGPDPKRKFYFADLPVDLQQVLRVQLQRAGDVSAVIETPEGFLLYLARKKTGEALGVAVLSLRKRNYEQWLEEQSGGSKK